MHEPRLLSHGCIFQLGAVRFYSFISPTTTREVDSYVVPVLWFSIARRRSLPLPLFLDSHFFYKLLATASESVLQCSVLVSGVECVPRKGERKKKNIVFHSVWFSDVNGMAVLTTCCVSAGVFEQSSKFHDSSAPRFVSWDVLVLCGKLQTPVTSLDSHWLESWFHPRSWRSVKLRSRGPWSLSFAEVRCNNFIACWILLMMLWRTSFFKVVIYSVFVCVDSGSFSA